jgi:hypothetical protein
VTLPLFSDSLGSIRLKIQEMRRMLTP